MNAPARATPRHRLGFALLMTWIAGYLDAVGYVQLGHLYVSFMSGNSTQLGMALAEGRPVALILAIIASFVLGSALGTLLAETSTKFALVAVFVGEIVVFLVAIGLVLSGHGRIGLALVAVAMGMQNTQHQAIAGADVGKGFITGALFAFGASLVHCLQGKVRPLQVLSNFLSWGAFVAGVFAGALALAGMGLALSLAVVVLLLGMAICAIFPGVS